MKKLKVVFYIFVLGTFITAISCKQSSYALRPNEVPEVTHVNLNDFPKGKVLPMIDGWGGLTVDVNNAPKGTNFTPLLEGLENDHCQVPHWGYVVEGAVSIEYEDGNKETFKEGEAFYMKPGHTALVLEDLKLVSFSPEDGMHELSDHLEKKVAEMSKK
ncbi:MAG: hypothetical protein ABFR62_11315 [Bacteroidota bacterium]